jgi:hypothetical protein
MSNKIFANSLLALLLLSLPAFAQFRRPALTGRPHEEPCWQVAGIPKSAIEERQAIARQTRAQVEAVCADHSLSAQERQQKIREIHQQAKLKSEGLVTPQQQEALQACQKERATSHRPAIGVHRGGGTGPCGELLPEPKPHPGPTGAGSNQGTGQETPPQ